uniref:Uncharacterized protein n=2 Tax=Bionectria ochroleuca TaxID=29856 RepID=A0A8H7NHJ0_BIOOC
MPLACPQCSAVGLIIGLILVLIYAYYARERTMSALIFCCTSTKPRNPRKLDHEPKFEAFIQWARSQTTSTLTNAEVLTIDTPYAVQLVRQINYGPQESIRYFIPLKDGSRFVETREDSLLKWNFEKLNSFKNFICNVHNKYFEVNLYQRSPFNAHHWRADIARPSRDIDLAYRTDAKRLGAEVDADEPRDLSRSLVGRSVQPTQGDLRGKEIGETEKAARRCSSNTGSTDLKQILQFLLPKVQQTLGPSSLVSLLCLDRANTELSLRLDVDSLWENELSTSSILRFFTDCLPMDPASPPVDLGETEELIVRAMRHVCMQQTEHSCGKNRVARTVNKVLDLGHDISWVRVYGDEIMQMFESGPSKEVLEHCQGKVETIHAQAYADPQNLRRTDDKKIRKELWWSSDDDIQFDDRDVSSSHEDVKDFTACDKECGYCGHCDY